MDEFIKRSEELTTVMWKTAGTRFLAAHRLSRRDRLATFSISLLSVVAVAVGLLEPHVSAAAHHIGLSTTIISAIMSVFILAISLMEGSAQSAVQADKLHESGTRIADVRRGLEDLLARSRGANAPSWNQYENLRTSYETLLRECPFNHEPIDFKQFEVNHRHSNAFSQNGHPRVGWLEALLIRFLYLANAAWLPMASWVVVGILILLIVAP
jgi:SMODS and SLOG-associating 2TM effector domain family 5